MSGSQQDPVSISSDSDTELKYELPRSNGDGDSRLNESGLQLTASRCTSSKDPFKGKKFRWWFFTWNNPEHDSDAKSLLAEKKIQYIKFQYERGTEGTKHYQGVFYVPNKSSCRALMQWYKWGYLAPVKSISGAINYCGKEDTRIDGPWTKGKIPSQGSRSDLLVTKQIIDDGGSIEDCFEEAYGSMVRYHRGIQMYYNLKNKHRRRTWQTVCYVYYGDAGTGKTEAAKEESRVFGGGTYWLTLEGGTFGKVWWDNYNGEENIIIDEFNCQIKFTDFKRLVDSSPMTVPIKGGMVPFLGKRIWFLSNTPPNDWYMRAAPRDAPALRKSFTRRLHYQEYFETLFQDQPDYESFVFSRSQFVVAQQAGEYIINTNKV